MGLLSRSTSAPTAIYARVLDGAHLWLAVCDAEMLSLRRPGVDDLPVPAAVEGELLVARFAIAEALAGDSAPDVELRLHDGSGRRSTAVAHAAAIPASPTAHGSVTPDGRWLLDVLPVDGEVVVRRTARVPVVSITRVSVVDGGVELQLDTVAEHAEVVVGDTVLARLPLADGRLTLEEMPGLEPGVTATLRVDAVPVVRAGNVLLRPNHAVNLPALSSGHVLRWQPDGRLTLRVPEPRVRMR